MRRYKFETAQNSFTILTLDDDPIITATVQAYFQRSGYQVDTENDPLRAIERVREGHYDILLLDFLMRPICGDQVVEAIRAFNQEIFIILLTGHKSMAPPIKTIRELDIQGYYEKSDRFDQLELLVESCAKSLRQMRKVRGYQKGLSDMLESLPQVYHLQSVQQITDKIIDSMLSMMGSNQGCLALRSHVYHGNARTETADGGGSYMIRSRGDGFVSMQSRQVDALLEDLKTEGPLLWRDNALYLTLEDGREKSGLLGVRLGAQPEYEKRQLFEVFGRHISAALHNAHLHQQLQSKNEELKGANTRLNDSYFEMISAMRLMVDAKDPYTRGHSDRVAYYAAETAKYMGRDEAYCQRVHVAGLFHDIGKIGVMDSVLLKEGRLTDEEFAHIKTHPGNGATILSAISHFRPIVPVVRAHHERFDGSGYPDRLSGETIPEEARIIAVADAFDAMTSDRRYRKSLGTERAFDALREGRGTQFDAEIADMFLAWAQSQDVVSNAVAATLGV